MNNFIQKLAKMYKAKHADTESLPNTTIWWYLFKTVCLQGRDSFKANSSIALYSYSLWLHSKLSSNLQWKCEEGNLVELIDGHK